MYLQILFKKKIKIYRGLNYYDYFDKDIHGIGSNISYMKRKKNRVFSKTEVQVWLALIYEHPYSWYSVHLVRINPSSFARDRTFSST